MRADPGGPGHGDRDGGSGGDRPAVAEARWAYGGSAQGGKKIASGNTRVIAALAVRLPVLSRLWRGNGTASQVQLAAGLPELLVKAFPGRQAHGTGDAAFHGEPLVTKGPAWTTRLPASAVISGPEPPPTGRRGRPRKQGDRIGTCKDAAAAADWQDVTVRIYGKEQKAQAAAWPCPWYGSFKDAPGQLVLMREPDTAKATPAAADMHAALRDALTEARINAISPGDGSARKSTASTLTSETHAA